MRRIHSAASPSSPSPTTRQMRPTPVPTSAPTDRAIDQAREREIADRSRADDDGGHSRLRGQSARFGRARRVDAGARTRDRRSLRPLALPAMRRPRARPLPHERPPRRAPGATPRARRRDRGRGGVRTCTRRKSRAATLSELASRSTAPATLPPPRSSAATCSSTEGSAATNRRSCRARARCSANGAPTAPAGVRPRAGSGQPPW